MHLSWKISKMNDFFNYDGDVIVCMEPHQEYLLDNRRGVTEYDSGLGNRIFHWAVLHYISTLRENCILIVPKQYWPELEFLYLPDTIVVDICPLELKRNFLKISNEQIKDIANSQNFLSLTKNSYPLRIYANEWFGIMSDLPHCYESIKKIKFKNEEVNKFFQNNFSNYVSIHIRLQIGIYTIPSVGFIEEYILRDKSKCQEYIKRYILVNGDSSKYRDDIITQHKIKCRTLETLSLSDSAYYSIIDDIIDFNQNVKIYIGYDLTEDYYDHFYKKYPNNIVRRNCYLNEFLSFFDYDESKMFKYEYSSRNQILINLFDLFLFSYSKILIASEYATWAQLAKTMNKKTNMISPADYIIKKQSISITEFIQKFKYYPFHTLEDCLDITKKLWYDK